MKKSLFVVLAGVLFVAGVCHAQTATGETLMLNLPRASQHGLVSQRIGITDITINYHRPLANGRQVWGKLVPYGQVWRTGANEATTFVTDAGLSIGGKDIPGGSYTIFTVPNQDKWQLIVNKKNAEWGIPYKYEADELGRFDMSVSKTPGPVENFTISFHEMGDGCHMYMDWENTRATIEISEKK